MNILIAPDSFKGTLSSPEAAAAMATGIRRAVPGATLKLLPLADGGEGSADILGRALGGVPIRTTVSDPLGRPIDAHYVLLKETRTAIVEVAQASGLTRLTEDERNPLIATSFGAGELIAHALDQDLNALWVCLGGSATVDGGLGMLCALGARGFDSQGRIVAGTGQGLTDLKRIDFKALDPRLKAIQIVALCDVDNTLCGPSGARMFMAQKGADAAMIDQLDSALSKWAQLLQQHTGIEVADCAGAGAAGGLGAGLAGALKASLVSGSDFILDHIGFDAALDQADWVITGEGRVDAQSVHGKVIAAVGKRALAKSVSVTVVCGNNAIEGERPSGLGINDIVSIVPKLASESEAMAQPYKWLEAAAFRAGQLIAERQAGL